ncbi:hypothetical protein SAMN06264364_1175 [Quadrisphaera granulorum]|uniref:Uncharacterized protein n=1 Tax=Quadrisphaera granulorum TaxID=317664 RepID=A0A316A5B7_9ACTN|nr:hypothetical protein BXY45_1175 [Quadrisphaera granulorum]SZE97358.1 hypothetical protein SAMN06264364_1175 [Quadrisphaera granulorum]
MHFNKPHSLGKSDAVAIGGDNHVTASGEAQAHRTPKATRGAGDDRHARLF